MCAATRLRKFPLTLMLSVALNCAVGSDTALGQPSPSDDEGQLPTEVREQLERNALALSVSTIKYTRSQKGDVPKSYGGPTSYSAYFDDGRFYQRRESVSRNDGGLEKRIHVDAYDREIFYTGELELPGDYPATVVKYLVKDRSDPYRTSNLIEFPYMPFAGIHIPSTLAGLSQASFTSLVLQGIQDSTKTRIDRINDKLLVTVTIPDPLLTALRDVDLDEERKALEGGRNSPEFIAAEIATIAKLKQMPPFREVAYLLDPKYGYGIVERQERTIAGQELVKATADLWEHYEAQDVWLPRQCIEFYFTKPSAITSPSIEPVVTVTLDLKEIDFASKNNFAFAIDFSAPGSLVRERSSEEAREAPGHEIAYVMSGDGVTLRRSGEDALNELGGVSPLLIIVNFLLVVVLGILVLSPRARRFCGGLFE